MLFPMFGTSAAAGVSINRVGDDKIEESNGYLAGYTYILLIFGGLSSRLSLWPLAPSTVFQSHGIIN